MTQNELRERLNAEKYDGVFLFCGEEDYLKRHYIGELRRRIVTDEGIAPFVHFVFDGAEIDVDALLDIVRTPSMFGEAKLIEWHNADFDSMKEASLKAFEAFCLDAVEEEGNTIVVTVTGESLDIGTEKRPTKLFTRLSKVLHAVPFYRSTDAALISWIRRHFAAEGLSHTDTLPASMLARVGHDMDTLSNEIGKLSAYVKANGISPVTEKELSFVCIRTVESDAFSLTNALLDGRMEDAFRYLGDMKQRRVEPVSVLGQVAKLYADLLSVALLADEGMGEKEIAKTLGMHEYKAGLYFRTAKRMGVAAVEEKLALCTRIDASLKSGTSSYRGLEQLVATLGVK